MNFPLPEALKELRRATNGNFSINSRQEVVGGETITIRAGEVGETQRSLQYICRDNNDMNFDPWLWELQGALNAILKGQG